MKRSSIVKIIISTVSGIALLCLALLLFWNRYHVYEDHLVAANCTEGGYTIRTCKICNKEWKTDEKPALGHQESDWITDYEQTCVEDGVSHTECERCGLHMQERRVEAKHLYHMMELLWDQPGKMALYVCERCEDAYEDSFTAKEIGIPILSLEGDLSMATKTEAVHMKAEYESASLQFSSFASCRVQGSTSVHYPRKNYTIKFQKEDGSKKKISFLDVWGKHSKYCLKANWIDITQAKNIVSARLWGQVAHARVADSAVDELPNAGAIDGFPVIVYLNDMFYGLFTMNVPKDEWLFGMEGTEEKQAVVFQNSWSDSGKLMYPIQGFGKDGWILEYCSTEDSAWALQSFNQWIDFMNHCDSREQFLQEIHQYTSLERCLDTMVYTYFIKGVDVTSKNLLWVTYDGTKWLPQIYDLDSTWGLMWDGSGTTAADEYPLLGENVLYELLLKYCFEELCERYRTLRKTVLEESNIKAQFDAFDKAIPLVVWDAHQKRWPDAPKPEGNSLKGTYDWIEQRIQYFDDLYGAKE